MPTSEKADVSLPGIAPEDAAYATAGLLPGSIKAKVRDT